jgi:hypothetical protein
VDFSEEQAQMQSRSHIELKFDSILQMHNEMVGRCIYSLTATYGICDTERAHPVVPVGPLMAGMSVIPNHSGISALPVNRAAAVPSIATSSALPSSSRYPLNIGLTHSAASTLVSLTPAPTNPGYQEAHQYYNEMREHFAKKAYASSANVELVVVKVTFATLSPTKKSPLRISVSCISVSCGWDLIYCQEYLRGIEPYSSAHWSRGSQVHSLSRLASPVP